jgi:Chalcone isomerase-like
MVNKIFVPRGLSYLQMAVLVLWLPGAMAFSPNLSWLDSKVPGAQVIGSGLFRVFGFKVYEARLLANKTSDLTQWKNIPLALQLHYLRDVRGQQITQSTNDEIKRLDKGSPTQRQQWSTQLTPLFVDLKAGDTITGIHQPGGATAFYLNDKPLGQIEDPDFGVAFFSIWLDAKTKEPRLRQALLNDQR